MLVDPRSNSLIVRAANPARMASVRALVDKLDQPPQGAAAAGNIWVVHLKNADATKLATVLRAAFGAGAGGGGGGGSGVAGAQRRPAADSRSGNAGAAPAAPAARRRSRAADHAVGGAVDRRLHPGRPGDQLADHHRARAALPPGARGDRPARRAPRAGLHRER